MQEKTTGSGVATVANIPGKTCAEKEGLSELWSRR
jgi:hypothetical protein